ncbi:hypothetical protein UT300012_21840 [Paraclostridium bifermentans]
MIINKEDLFQIEDRKVLVEKINNYEVEDIINNFTLNELRKLYVKVYVFKPRSNATKTDIVNSLRSLHRSYRRAEAFNR